MVNSKNSSLNNIRDRVVVPALTVSIMPASGLLRITLYVYSIEQISYSKLRGNFISWSSPGIGT